MKHASIALLLLNASPAQAQAQAQAIQVPSSASTVIDPARLAASRELIDVLMPPIMREQMITSMLQPMLANMRQGLTSNPGFAKAMGGDPRVRALFDAFMAKQESRTTEMMQRALPGMFPAMANAYARRFDVRQLTELRAFFSTPTGRAYMQGALTIMSDPDIAAWQRELMTGSMSAIREDAAEFGRQVAALEKKP